MYLIHLYTLLIFGMSTHLCLSSPDNVDDYVDLDDSSLDWEATVASDEMYANVTDMPDYESATNDIGPPLTGNPIKTNTIDDVLAAESKVQELSAVLKTTIHRIRQQYKKMDIVFLIDSSSSVGKSNFRSELKFVTKFLSDFNVSVNYTRVSIVTFSSQEKIVGIW